MPGFKIRRATAKDIDLLVEHRHKMFEEMKRPDAKSLKIADESYREWAVAMMKRHLFYGYIVTSGRRLIAASGCVWIREVQPSPGRPKGRVPYVLSMYTSPEFRRNGLATMILKEATKWANERGYDKMTLHASSVGRKVYSQLGWTRTWEMEKRLK